MELDGQLHELEESNKVLVEDCNTIEKEREECLNLIDELKDLINLRDEDLEATNRELVEVSIISKVRSEGSHITDLLSSFTLNLKLSYLKP